MFTFLLPHLMPLRDEGPGGSNGGGSDPADLPDPDPAAPDPDPDPNPDNDDPDGVGGDGDLDPEALRRELARVRTEAANRRRQLREQETANQTLQEQNRRILEALGISDNTDDDPSAEAERLRQENRRLRSRQTFDAVARAAGVDEDLTWGYLLARGEIDSLDPDDDDFEATLQASISQAVEAKPSLKSNPPPPSRGGSDLDEPKPPAEDPAEMPMDQYMEWREKNLKQE